MLVAVLLLALMVAGALAVDISALERRGQTLQNAADAAALGGAVLWVNTGDQTDATATVEELLNQNGVNEAGVSWDISFDDESSVTVELVDSEPPVFLGSIVGFGGEVVRTASAQMGGCFAGCGRTFVVPPPLGEIQAVGTGDGWLPVAYRDRLYAVNHHGQTIQCVDRRTKSSCWASGQALFTDPALYTGHTTTAWRHGDRLYYLGFDYGSKLYLTCWDLVEDARCSNGVNVPPGNGSGVLVGAGNRMFVFTGVMVYCYLPISFDPCAGYGAGKLTSLPDVDLTGSSPFRQDASDYRLHDGRIYTSATRLGGALEVYVHCWDTATDAPCPSFGVAPLNAQSPSWDWVSGRLFFHRDATGTPNAICSIALATWPCFDLENGSPVSGLGEWFNTIRYDMAYPQYPFVGRPTYHPPSNRVFFVGDYRNSMTWCYDFSSSSNCGSVVNWTPYGYPETYGYIAEGDCLIGLGHESIFFTIAPDFGQADCSGAGVEFALDQCGCDDTASWPPLRLENADGVATFSVRISDASGTTLLPADGSDWATYLPDETVDLSALSTSDDQLQISIKIEPITGMDPWATGSAPQVVVVEATAGARLIE